MGGVHLIVILLVIGFIELLIKLVEINELGKRIEFFNIYHSMYVDYCNSMGIKSDKYDWLIKNCTKMQEELGDFGQVDFKPPFSNYYIKNYLILINGLSEIRTNFNNGFGSELAIKIDELLNMYGGWLNNEKDKKIKNLYNPIILINEGIKRLLSMPIVILFEIGVISPKSKSKYITSVLFKILTNIVTLVSFLSSIITILQFLGFDIFSLLV